MLFDLSGNNFHEAAETFSESFNTPPIVVIPTDKKFWWRQTAIGDPVLSLKKSWAFARFETTSIDVGQDYAVAWIESGHTLFENHGITRVAPTKAPYVTLNARPSGNITAIDVNLSLVNINQKFVRGVAEEMQGTDFFDFETLVPITGSQLLIWRKTVELVSPIILDLSHPATPLLRQEMPRLIAIAMLNCFPYHSHERPYKPCGVEPIGVRQAIDYIQHNAHLPISPIDVAHAAGLNVRSLQQALRRYREITPTALLHSIRLDRAHAELQAADPRIDSVSAIAHKWGFIHLGRFSGRYKTRFGQLPGNTLRSQDKILEAFAKK